MALTLGELLAATLPYEQRQEVMRAIREAEMAEAAKPCTKEEKDENEPD